MRPSRDDWALSLVAETAKRSTCLRRQVGCVLLNKRGHVLATGYNGVAAGLKHCSQKTGSRTTFSGINIENARTQDFFDYACPGADSPSGTNLDGCQAIHAEANALLQCRDVYEIETCYVSASPCIQCTKLLLNTGCQRIVFNQIYPHSDSAKLWEQAGRVWEHNIGIFG